MICLQKTVARPVTLEGVGLHTGEKTRLTFAPAPVDSGIVFHVRTDDGEVEIPALVESIVEAEPNARRTTLGKGDVRIHTVEHVLAALAGIGITNCRLELDGIEPPEPENGSALPIVDLLEEAGIREQGMPATYFRVQAPVRLRDGEVEIEVVPDERFLITFEIDYDDPLIGCQSATFELTPAVFREQIAGARTFVFMNDVPRLREKGLAQGGTLDNAVVIDDGKLADGQQLRFSDECVRHKILDLIGDLSLLGMPLRGHVTARRSGHTTNVEFTRMLARKERKLARIYPPREFDHWDICSIMDVMPHRYPFLLVDRILELEPGKRVVGLKNVTINEPFFQGHFPGHPIMPAVLIIEAMAQTGGVLLLSSVDEPGAKLVYFSGIDGARFRRPVLPGDQLRFELELIKLRGPICKMKGIAYVGDEKVAEADLMSTVVSR